MYVKNKILIVDDDRANIHLLKGCLKEDYTIVNASSGEEVFQILDSFVPDLILLDIVLPDISGIEICKRIVSDKKYSDIQIIMVTAKVGEGDVKKALDAGAIDYIKKPFSKIELIARVNSALRLKKYIMDLKEALLRVKTLSSLLPICANCKKIRNDEGYWLQVEQYLENYSDFRFTHSICPICEKKLYSQYYDTKNNS